jgi:SAM-dependent methyltransferase
MMDNIFRNSAWLYDLDQRDNYTADIPFYLDYATQQKGEILELGCGTGRVAVALAAEGFRITGLDLSEQMLEIFREKLTAKPELADKITLVHGNMADFAFDRKFSMIIAPFRAFQALTDDSEINNSLVCIYEHLTDTGIFIVNVFSPNRPMDESWRYPETVEWERLDEKTGNYVVRKHWGDKIDIVNQVIYPHFAFDVTYPDGRVERITDNLKLKYYYSAQLRATIEKSGMEITEEYSWYDKSAPGEREIIFVCRR